MALFITIFLWGRKLDRVTRWMVDFEIWSNKTLLRLNTIANYNRTVKAFTGDIEIKAYAKSKLNIR
jgi:glutamate formiminotransferase